MEIVTCQLSRERKFSDAFRGYRKATPGCNGLIKFVELIYRAIFSWRKLTIDYLCFSFLHWLFLKIMYSRSNETGTLDVLKIKFSSLPNHGDRACWLACPTCFTCPRAQVYFTDRKIKNIGFNEIEWRFVHWFFQGCWILIWTLIKISFLNRFQKY